MVWHHKQLEDAARNPFGLLPAESWIKSTISNLFYMGGRECLRDRNYRPLFFWLQVLDDHLGGACLEFAELEPEGQPVIEHRGGLDVGYIEMEGLH